VVAFKLNKLLHQKQTDVQYLVQLKHMFYFMCRNWKQLE